MKIIKIFLFLSFVIVGNEAQAGGWIPHIGRLFGKLVTEKAISKKIVRQTTKMVPKVEKLSKTKDYVSNSNAANNNVVDKHLAGKGLFGQGAKVVLVGGSLAAGNAVNAAIPNETKNKIKEKLNKTADLSTLPYEEGKSNISKEPPIPNNFNQTNESRELYQTMKKNYAELVKTSVMGNLIIIYTYQQTNAVKQNNNSTNNVPFSKWWDGFPTDKITFVSKEAATGTAEALLNNRSSNTMTENAEEFDAITMSHFDTMQNQELANRYRQIYLAIITKNGNIDEITLDKVIKTNKNSKKNEEIEVDTENNTNKETLDSKTEELTKPIQNRHKKTAWERIKEGMIKGALTGADIGEKAGAVIGGIGGIEAGPMGVVAGAWAGSNVGFRVGAAIGGLVGGVAGYMNESAMFIQTEYRLYENKMFAIRKRYLC